jgi:hypothetical protein
MTTPLTPRSSRFAAARSIALGGILATALILAACAQTPSQPDPDPDPQPTTLAGIVQIPPAELDDPEIIAVAASLLMLDMAFPDPPDDGDDTILLGRLQTAIERASVDASTVAPASVVEIEEGTYLAGIALIEADGGYELVLPDFADIPEPLFRTAAEAIPLSSYAGGADCTLAASDPEALVTLTFWQFLSSATPVLYTQFGLALGFTVTEAVDFEGDDDLDDLTFVTLAYATAPTTLTSTGPECSTVGGTISVDVALEEGWNQVTWSFSETTFTVGVRPVDSAVYTVPLAVGL